jgi:ankyrin repeat protein
MKGGEYGTSLAAAAARGDTTICHMLLASGADLDVRAEARYLPNASAAVFAAKDGHTEVLQQLLEAYTTLTVAFEAAVISQQRATAEVLLSAGVNVDDSFSGDYWHYATIRDDISHAVLQAAKNGDIDMMRVLATAGANIDVASQHGWTALHYVASLNHTELLALLIDELEADMNLRLGNGSLPIHLAAEGGHDIAIRILLDRGAPVNDQNHNGRTPLHVAADKCTDTVAETLLSYGARLDVQDQTGLTPMGTAEFALTEAGNQMLIRDEKSSKRLIALLEGYSNSNLQ